jgi:hypothetical protein
MRNLFRKQPSYVTVPAEARSAPVSSRGSVRDTLASSCKKRPRSPVNVTQL